MISKEVLIPETDLKPIDDIEVGDHLSLINKMMNVLNVITKLTQERI